MHKKSSNPLQHIFLLTTACLLALSGAGLSQEPPPSKAQSPQHPVRIATDCAGIVASIWEISRLSENRLLIDCGFDNLSAKPAFLAANIRKVKQPGIDGGPSTEGSEFEPYNISAGAILTDERTGLTYKAFHSGPASSGFGFRPGDGTAFSVTFPAPPPPPPPEKPDAKPEKQTVSIRLPQVKEPFRNIVIPQNEGEVIKFHPN
jgi:hypothetical protein